MKNRNLNTSTNSCAQRSCPSWPQTWPKRTRAFSHNTAKAKKLWPHFDFGSHVGLRLLPCVSFEQHVQNMCESQLRHLCPVQFDPLVKGVPQGVQDLACLLERFPTRGWAHFDKRLRPAMHSHQKRHDWRHRDHFLRLSRHDGAVSCVKASNTLPFTHPDEVHA